MPAGRPTKLTPLVLEMAQNYLKDYETVVPTIEGLALHIHVSRETVYDWYKNSGNKQFSDIVNDLQSIQANTLINGTLEGKYNPAIAKLLLSARHNYVEKKEEKVTVEMPKPILELNELRSNDSNKEISEPQPEN
jgi:hypothetical protein